MKVAIAAAAAAAEIELLIIDDVTACISICALTISLTVFFF